MSATTLFYLLFFLVTGIWALVLLSFWYGHYLLRRQKELFACLMPYLDKIQSERETIQSLSISDTTPLSKLQDVTLPDHIHLDFQHHAEEK